VPILNQIWQSKSCMMMPVFYLIISCGWMYDLIPLLKSVHQSNYFTRSLCKFPLTSSANEHWNLWNSQSIRFSRHILPRRWRHNRCCPLFPNHRVISMLGQTPGIVTYLGFLTRQLASSWYMYMSETEECCIAGLLVSILISVTPIIAKTTWEQRILSFK
jgi:hypothetical protein